MDSSDARMKRLEENLDGLIRAITAEHTSQKAKVKSASAAIVSSGSRYFADCSHSSSGSTFDFSLENSLADSLLLTSCARPNPNTSRGLGAFLWSGPARRALKVCLLTFDFLFSAL